MTMSRTLAVAAAVAVLFIAASTVEAYPRTRTVKVRPDLGTMAADAHVQWERNAEIGPAANGFAPSLRLPPTPGLMCPDSTRQ